MDELFMDELVLMNLLGVAQNYCPTELDTVI
jgi:hypothetical protein